MQKIEHSENPLVFAAMNVRETKNQLLLEKRKLIATRCSREIFGCFSEHFSAFNDLLLTTIKGTKYTLHCVIGEESNDVYNFFRLLFRDGSDRSINVDIKSLEQLGEAISIWNDQPAPKE